MSHDYKVRTGDDLYRPRDIAILALTLPTASALAVFLVFLMTSR